MRIIGNRNIKENAKERRNVRAILFDDSSEEVEYLLLYARKGYWQFPQGGIDLGESEIEAVQREVLEQLKLMNLIQISHHMKSLFEY